MVKHTKTTIRQEQPANCLSVFDHFVELTVKWLIFKEILGGAKATMIR